MSPKQKVVSQNTGHYIQVSALETCTTNEICFSHQPFTTPLTDNVFKTDSLSSSLLLLNHRTMVLCKNFCKWLCLLRQELLLLLFMLRVRTVTTIDNEGDKSPQIIKNGLIVDANSLVGSALTFDTITLRASWVWILARGPFPTSTSHFTSCCFYTVLL